MGCGQIGCPLPSFGVIVSVFAPALTWTVANQSTRGDQRTLPTAVGGGLGTAQVW